MSPSGISETACMLLDYVANALDADLRPVCKVYQTVGTPVILTCCECEEGTNGELSIHFTRLFDAESDTLLEVQRIRPCRGGVTAAQYRLVLARCYPTIDERGEIPEPDVLEAVADEFQRDAELMWQSLACSGESMRIDDLSVDLGPKAGCAVMSIDVTIQVLVPALPPLSYL